VTALLFTLGKTGIGFYLGRSATASSYGAAGSVILLLLWVYYSAQIVLVGAEFTRLYTLRHGAVPKPEDFAERDGSPTGPARSAR
jgi:membrane protein